MAFNSPYSYHFSSSLSAKPSGANGVNGHSPTSANGVGPESAVEKVKRHPEYYLHGGDIHFLVENFIFRVHRYFFERESAYFREKLGIPASAGQSPKGSSDVNPCHLEDVRAKDFAQFLWVFYNPIYSIYDATVEQWSSILKLAYDFRFAEIKKLCCRELEKFDIEPVLKIELYQRYDLDKKLLIPSYAALVVRPDPLSLREGRQLGLETALLIATARECARGTLSEHGRLSPKAASLDTDPLVRVIKEVFGLSPNPNSPPLSPITAPGGFSAIHGGVPSISPRPSHSRQVSASATSSFAGAARPGSPLASGVYSSFGELANTLAVDPAATDASTTLPADTPAVNVDLMDVTSQTGDVKDNDKSSCPSSIKSDAGEAQSNADPEAEQASTGDGTGVADGNDSSDPPAAVTSPGIFGDAASPFGNVGGDPAIGNDAGSSAFGNVGDGQPVGDADNAAEGADGGGDPTPGTPAGDDGAATDAESGVPKKKNNRRSGGSGRGRGGRPS